MKAACFTGLLAGACFIALGCTAGMWPAFVFEAVFVGFLVRRTLRGA